MNDRRMMIAFLLVGLAAIQMEHVIARTDKWSRYSVGNGGFSGEFPSEPQLETRSLQGMPGKIHLCTSRDEEMNTFGAMFMDDVGVNLDKFSQAQLDDFYKATAAGVKKGMLQELAKLDGTLEVTETGEKQVVFAGLAGRELDYAVGPAKGVVKMSVRGRALLMGFAAVVSDLPDKSLETFFGSFQLSKGPAK